MKLHLPTRLRAAVLACITAVAALTTTIGTGVITTGAAVYTLSAVSSTAAAAEYTINVSTATEIMFNDGSGNKHLSESRAGDVITLNVTQPSGNGGYFESLGNNETKTIAADLIINSLVFNNGYSGSNRTYLFTGNISGSGDFTRGNNQSGNVFRFTGDVSGYTGNISFATKANSEANKLFFDASSRGDGMTVNAASITMQPGSVLQTAGNVTFSGTIDAGAVTIGDGVVTLAEGATATFGSGLTLSSGATLTVGSGATLNLTLGSDAIVPGTEKERTEGNGWGTVDYAKNFGTTLVNNGGVIRVNGSAASLAEGVLTSKGDSSTYYINEAAQTINATGATAVVVRADVASLTGLGSATSIIFDGGSATMGTTGQEVKGDVVIKNGSTVTVGLTDGMSYGVTGKSLTIEKGGVLSFGTKRYTVGHYKIILKGGVISGVGQDSNGALDFNAGDGGIVAKSTGVSADVSTISANVRLRTNINIDVEEGATLSMEGLINGGAAFTKVGEGKLILAHDNTCAGTTNINAGTVETKSATALGTGKVVINGGTLSVAEGTALTIGAMEQTGGTVVNNGTLTANGALSLSSTWDNTNGTINFGSSATITLTNMSAFEGEHSYSEETQGFMAVTSAKIINGGTLTGYDGVTVTINGAASSLNENGYVALSGDTDYTTYYLNDGTRVLSELVTASSDALTTVVMAEGTSLTVDSGTVQGTVAFGGEKSFSVADGVSTALADGLSVTGLKIGGESAANLTVENGATVNIIGDTNGGTANFNIKANGKLNFLAGDGGSAAMTVGSIKNDVDESNNYERAISVGTGVTLTAASLANSWGIKSLTVDGSLNVTGALTYSTAGNSADTNLITGSGSITAGSLGFANASTINTISVNSLTVEGDANFGRDVQVTDGTTTVKGNTTQGNTLTIAGGSLVLGDAAEDTIALNGTVKVESGSMTLNGATTIGNNGHLNVNGGTLQVNGNVSGMVTVNSGVAQFGASETPHTTSALDISNNDTSIGHVLVQSGASVVMGGELWLSSKNEGVLLEEGASLTTHRGGIKVTGAAEGASISISEGQGKYIMQGDNADKFVFTNAAVSVANETDTSLATQFSNSSVENLGAGLLTVISDGEGAITDVKATNGNIAINSRTNETTIELGTVTLGAGKTLTLNNDVTLGGLTVDLAAYVTEVPTDALTLISTAAGKSITCTSLDTTPQLVTIGETKYFAELGITDNCLTVAYKEATELYWNGGTGNISDSSWAAKPGTEAGAIAFLPGKDVIFDGAGGDITVDSAVTVGNVTVSGNYSFTSTGSMTIGGTLTVDCPESKTESGVTMTVDALPTASSVVVNEGATLELAQAAVRGATQDLLAKTTGAGAVQLATGSEFTDDTNRLSIGNATVTASTKLVIDGDLAVNGWTSDKQTGKTGSLVLTKDTTVGGEIRMETGAKLVIGEGASLTAAKLGLGHESESAMAVGHLEMTGGTLNVGTIGLNNNQANTIDITGGTLTITGANAFTGTGTGTTVSINGATLATDGKHSWTLNHTATLTDVTVSAAKGTSITLGATDAALTFAGTLTNTGAMALGGDLTMGSMDNSAGSINLGSHALTLTAATANGGTMTGAGTLTLTGANSFTALTLGTLDISAAGTSATVEGALAANTVKLGAFSNTLTAATLGGNIAFNADAVELNKGMHTVATLTGESANFGSSTLVIGTQTITIGSDPVELTGTGQLVSLVTSEDGKTLSVVVAYNGSEWTEEVDPISQEAQWTQSMVTSDSVNFGGKGSDTVTVAEDITVGTIVVDSDTEAKDYTFAGDNSVTTDKLDMSTGSSTLTVATDMVVNTDATIGGSTADDTATLTVADGGSLTAASVTVNSEGGLQVDGTANIDALTVAADNALAIGTTGAATIGTLSAADEQTIDIANDGALTVTNGTIDSLTGSGSLTVADGGAVTVTDDLAMTGDLTANGALTIEGDLDAAALSGTGSVSATGAITANSISGVSVSADTLSATQVGNTVKDLTINTLEVTTVQGIGADIVTDTDRDSYMEVSGTVGTLDTGITTITIVLTDDAKTAVMTEMETAAARDYLIIDGTTAVNKFVFDDGQKQEFLKEGYKTSLVQGSVHLSVTGLTAAEKSWTVGAAKTTGGLDITTTGADAYAELATDGVENVHVANNGTIDLTGAPTEVTLKNLTSAAETTLTVTGDTGDTAALLATDAAGDYASKAHAGTLKADKVNVSVEGGEAKLGALELTNGAALTTTQGSSLSVGKLNAASATAGSIAGDITVTGQGGSYKGSYANPVVMTVNSGADQTMVGSDMLNLEGAGKVTLLGANGVATVNDLEMNGATLALGSDKLSVVQEDAIFTNGTLSATLSVTDAPVALIDAKGLDLTGTKLALTLTGNLMDLIDGASDITLATLGTDTITTDMTVTIASSGLGKYFRNVAVQGTAVLAERNAVYYSDVLGNDGNVGAGAAMLDGALLNNMPQLTNPTGDLAAVMDALDHASSKEQAESLATAVSGASVAAMGSALSGDVERQLKAIRNRTTVMGVNQSVINEEMPYLNAWVNAEGDYRDIAADGNMPGYKLSSWGGTVGFDVDCTPSFTCGLAATAMYGNFDADGEDHATGNLDTYYVTAFGRYAKHRWTHTFVATAGMADTSLERTVGGAKTKGDSDGTMFGGMYEVGYVFALDEDATTCLQPIVNVSYTHATLNGFEESGSDLALKTGDVEMNKLTVGLGARLQSVMGENFYNRSSIFEARALVKFDAGDRQGEVTNAFAKYAGKGNAKSVETGAVGTEFGVGVTVPVGSEAGNIFIDASAELRTDYVNVNGTVGYRVNF
ncbi:MAG: hypothetical protein MJ051_03405 [Akkermansia sp.]|nr:hypothetical protein [Akkermansia sp.]